MNRLASITFFIIFCLIYTSIEAQDTLPKFTIRDINDKKILISWVSPFGINCIQLAVQRSYDSTRFFSTIYSVQSPELPQNGVLDNRVPKGIKVFYRIFYVLQDGQYFFSNSVGLYSFNRININQIQTPSPTQNNNINVDKNSVESNNATSTPTVIKQYLSIYKRSINILYEKIEAKDFRHLRDSIAIKKDTLYRLDSISYIIKTFVPKQIWRASKFVFTNEATNSINISLPQAKLHRYRIVFFEENGTQLFEIRQPKEDYLVLDNANFAHGGWFNFDLYEDEKLKEHNKFMILIPF